MRPGVTAAASGPTPLPRAAHTTHVKKSALHSSTCSVPRTNDGSLSMRALRSRLHKAARRVPGYVKEQSDQDGVYESRFCQTSAASMRVVSHNACAMELIDPFRQ